jgi:hypothetical protein
MPNHTGPWTAFHGEAWCAFIMACLAIVVAVQSYQDVGWNGLTAALGALLLLPWLQFAGGQIPSYGVALMHSMYLLGLLLAIRTGQIWEASDKYAAVKFLFVAAGVGSVISVTIELLQWFAVSVPGPWVLQVNNERMFANFGQPNQLGSLLLLGLIGVSWIYWQQKIKPIAAIGLAAFFTMGIALTGSRTAWLNMAILLVFAVANRETRRKGYLNYLLISFFIMMILSMLSPLLHSVLVESAEVSVSAPVLRSMSDPIRTSMWKHLLEASLASPWIGFGWGNFYDAMLLVAKENPSVTTFFPYGHNLFLDLILWCGYPLGFSLIVFALYWLYKILMKIKTWQQLHMFAFIVVLGVHSMLEFPLYYSYFLLPFGLMVGALYQNTIEKRGSSFPKVLHLLAVFLVLVFIIQVVRDYLRIEQSLYGLRFETKGIATEISREVPEVLTLPQFSNYLKMARIRPNDSMTTAELEWMDNVVRTIPGAYHMEILAEAYALNKQAQTAAYWLKMICQSASSEICMQMRMKWESQTRPEIKEIHWPS